MLRSLFGTKSSKATPDVVRNLSELRPHLERAGYSIEDRDPVTILGIDMERLRMRQSSTFLAVGFGGGYFHIVQMVGLARILTPKETVDFNASVQIFNVTPNNDPPAAIVKAHVPALFGALPTTIVDLLAYSEEAVEKLITTVGHQNVRAI